MLTLCFYSRDTQRHYFSLVGAATMDYRRLGSLKKEHLFLEAEKYQVKGTGRCGAW
jgi:hypothetical protein